MPAMPAPITNTRWVLGCGALVGEVTDEGGDVTEGGFGGRLGGVLGVAGRGGVTVRFGGGAEILISSTP